MVTGASNTYITERTPWLIRRIRRIGPGVYQGKEMGVKGEGMGEYNSVTRIV